MSDSLHILLLNLLPLKYYTITVVFRFQSDESGHCVFHCFDSHCRDDRGMCSTSGKAVLMEVSSMSGLVTYVMDLAKSLFRNLDSVPFELQPAIISLVTAAVAGSPPVSSSQPLVSSSQSSVSSSQSLVSSSQSSMSSSSLSVSVLSSQCSVSAIGLSVSSSQPSGSFNGHLQSLTQLASNNGHSLTSIQQSVSCQGTAGIENKHQSKSSYSKYPWIKRSSDGYKCSVCIKYGSVKYGKWISDLIPLSASKKLAEKAVKHSRSNVHCMALAAESTKVHDMNVQQRVMLHCNKQLQKDHSLTKDLLKLAYYLFRSEIPHTTSNWPELIATAASLDESGNFMSQLKNCPQNAHRLSSTTATDFLEAFGEAGTEMIRKRLCGKTQFAVMADECTDINGRAVLSICIRHIVTEHASSKVEETFLTAVVLESTTAANITENLVSELQRAGLDPRNITAVSFDGGANFSGHVNGVQAKLRQFSPNLLFVHCRSHLLQLALVHSCKQSPHIKRVISALSKLYSTFAGSNKRLAILQQTERVIDGKCHKLVQPGDTRWLSNEASVSMVFKHYASICIALEHIYVEAGDHSSDAGGLLLLLRKKSTAFIVSLLKHFLSPLANLSKSLQSSTGNLTEAVSLVKVVLMSLKEIEMVEVMDETNELINKALEHKVCIEEDDGLAEKELLKLATNYRDKIIENMNHRFSDKFNELVKFHDIFLNKLKNPDFTVIAEICNVSCDDMQREYNIYSRYPGSIESHENLLKLACEDERKCMFPTLAVVATCILLLPVGTAGVERTFSTMNRILCSERSRLLPSHVNALMKIAIEGPAIPSFRDDSQELNQEQYNQYIDTAYSCWLAKPRRNV